MKIGSDWLREMFVLLDNVKGVWPQHVAAVTHMQPTQTNLDENRTSLVGVTKK